MIPVPSGLCLNEKRNKLACVHPFAYLFEFWCGGTGRKDIACFHDVFVQKSVLRCRGKKVGFVGFVAERREDDSRQSFSKARC